MDKPRIILRARPYVSPCLAAQFPHFDLHCLTQKQLDVLEMRYCGGLSWRKIAAFEGVSHISILERHRAIKAKLAQLATPTTSQ